MKITKLLVLGALCLTATSAMAVDGNVWTKPAIPTEYATMENGGTYYFLNVGSQLFFTQGNAWGTQASVGETGLKVRIEEAGTGDYTLTDFVKTQNAWKMWWFIDSDDDPTMYVDYNGQANYYWTITDMGNQTYRLSPSASNPFASFANLTYVGLNRTEDAERTYLTWNNTEDSGAFIDWKLIPEEAGEAYEAQMDIYTVAMELKKVLDEGESINAAISAETAVYNNTASTKAELQAAIDSAKKAIEKRKAEMVDEQYDNATVESPVVVTDKFIVNPGYADGNTNGWSGSGASLEKHGDNYTAEFYNTTYDTYQKLSGMKAGVYVLNLNGFYRQGWIEASFANHFNGTEKLNALLYATVGETTYTTPMQSIYADASTEGYGNGTESTQTDEATGTTLYFPNMRESAQLYFDNGHYAKNEVLFAIDEAQEVTIGLKKTVSETGDWTPFGKWSLTYYGKGADAYQMWLDEVLKNYGEVTPAEGELYTEAYLEAYNEVLKAEHKAASKEEAEAEIATIEAAHADLQKNIDLWKQWQQTLQTAYTTYCTNPDYDELENTLLLGDYYDNNVKLDAEGEEIGVGRETLETEHNLTNEQLEEEIAWINALVEAILEEYRTALKPGDDVTMLLTNPDFEKGTTGWQGNPVQGSGGGNTCVEAYARSNFDIYQEVAGTKAGVYQIEVQGFFRIGRPQHENATTNSWAIYAEGFQKAPAWVYLNNSESPIKCIYELSEDEKSLVMEPGEGETNIYTQNNIDAPGDGYQYPNTMEQAAQAFAAGLYKSSAYGLISKAGDKLRIGVKGSLTGLVIDGNGTTANDNWTIWDNFKLTYQGMLPEYVKPALEDALAQFNELDTTKPMGKDVRDRIATTKSEAEAALGSTDGQEMFQKLAALVDLAADIRASITTFEGLSKAVNDLSAAMDVSEANAQTRADAGDLYDKVNQGILNGTINDSEVAGLIDEINAMITKLGIPADAETASDENPSDMTAVINNPSYDTNSKDGWTIEFPDGGSNHGVSYNVAESFGINFDYYQNLSGLPEGTYGLTVQAFYRAGNAKDDYTRWTEDPTAMNYAQLYAMASDSVICSKAITRLASEAVEHTDCAGAIVNARDEVIDEVSGDITQTALFVPNSMETASYFFDGTYSSIEGEPRFTDNKVIVKVNADGQLRIGIRKLKNVNDNWTIWDNWKLYYYGKNSSQQPSIDAIRDINSARVANIEFFTIDGRRASAAQRGIVIRKMTLEDGTIVVSKIRK